MRKAITHRFVGDRENSLVCGKKWLAGRTSALIKFYWDRMVDGSGLDGSKPCPKCLSKMAGRKKRGN